MADSENIFLSYYRNQRIASVIIISLAGLIAALYIFVHFFLTPVVKDKIIKSVSASSDGLYNLQMDDFGLRFWTGAFYMDNVKLVQNKAVLAELRKKDPSANFSDISIVIKEVAVSRIWWENFLFDKSLKVGRIFIDHPEFNFSSRLPVDTIKVEKNSFVDVLPAIIASFAGSLKIEELRVEQGILHHDVLSDAGVNRQYADSIFVDLKNIKIDTVSQKINALFTNDVSFEIRNYQLMTSDQLYKMNVGSLQGSYADSILDIKSIALVPATKEKVKDHYNIFIKEISTRGIDYSLFFKKNKVSLGTMKIDGPDIDLIYHMAASSSADSSSKKTKSKMDIIATAFQYMAATFKMKRLIIENGNFNSSFISANGTTSQKASDLMLTFDSIQIDTVTLKNGKYWKAFELSLTNYEGRMTPQNLKLTLNSVDASSQKSNLNLTGVQVAQLHPSKKGEQMYFKNYSKSINLSGIDYHRLLYGEGVSVKKMDINEMKIAIYNDEAYATKNAYTGQMPNELIRNVPTYLCIENLNINDAFIKYQDQSPDVKEPGILTFENTTLNISNLTNDKLKNTSKTPAILKGETKVMGKGLLKLDIKMPLLSPQFNCDFKGSLGEIEGKYFNSFLAYGGMELESGTIEAQNFQVNVVNGKASGNMLLLYHDLNAKLVNKKTGNVKHLVSHIANFILKNENKSDKLKKPRVVGVQYDRKNTDGFLTYIWGSISRSITEAVVKDFFQPVIMKKK
jgi:hypothetical protein